MNIYRIRQAVGAAIVAGAVFAPGVAHAATPTEHLRGTIVSTTASTVTIKTATGQVTVAIGPTTKIAGAVPGSTADIAPGKFLGIASVPGSGPNKALEVVVFPDSMRGAGEGDYPWDLSASGAHSTMTNGTVGMPATHSTMTNATVGSMSGSGEKTITMNYKGGSRTLVIPANAPVVRVAPGTTALFVPGSHVFVIAVKAASPVAGFVVVGEHGTALPM
jgi:hypothetical protein